MTTHKNPIQRLAFGLVLFALPLSARADKLYWVDSGQFPTLRMIDLSNVGGSIKTTIISNLTGSEHVVGLALPTHGIPTVFGAQTPITLDLFTEDIITLEHRKPYLDISTTTSSTAFIINDGSISYEVIGYQKKNDPVSILTPSTYYSVVLSRTGMLYAPGGPLTSSASTKPIASMPLNGASLIATTQSPSGEIFALTDRSSVYSIIYSANPPIPTQISAPFPITVINSYAPTPRNEVINIACGPDGTFYSLVRRYIIGAVLGDVALFRGSIVNGKLILRELRVVYNWGFAQMGDPTNHAAPVPMVVMPD